MGKKKEEIRLAEGRGKRVERGKRFKKLWKVSSA